jgi:hypothetical protein
MAFGFGAPRFAFFRLNLGPKAVISAALLIAVNTAERDIDVNLRTLSLAFGEAFPDAKVSFRDGAVDRIEIARMPEFADHKLVDRATSYVGGNATLFVYDDASQQFVRKTTNVKKENGDRAVGTHNWRPIIPGKPHFAAANPTKARRRCSAVAFTQPISRCSVQQARSSASFMWAFRSDSLMACCGRRSGQWPLPPGSPPCSCWGSRC